MMKAETCGAGHVEVFRAAPGVALVLWLYRRTYCLLGSIFSECFATATSVV
jgi:hypothetical protein